jgi:hypothetical protein
MKTMNRGFTAHPKIILRPERMSCLRKDNIPEQEAEDT